jgi:hypothetical protein
MIYKKRRTARAVAKENEYVSGGIPVPEMLGNFQARAAF